MLGRQLVRLTAGARLLVLVAMGAPILWARDTPALLALVGVAGVWFVAQMCADLPMLARLADPAVEAALVGVICGFALHSSLAILAALTLAPFVGGLRRAIAGVAFTSSAQVLMVLVVSVLRFGGLNADQSLAVFTWSVAGVGLGFIAVFVRSAALDRDDELAPYLEAKKLIRELIDISGGLRSGLDVTSLGGLVLSRVGDRLPTTGLALYVPRGEVLVPLLSESSEDQQVDDVEALAVESWARTQPLAWEHAFAFPLGESAILGGSLAETAGVTEGEVQAVLVELIDELRPLAVQLDTALLFDEFRDSTAADVRQRLAREMHDGIAQDIASLGYLVDALAAKPATEKQGKQFAMLRERITKIVGEVRQSVLTLRTTIGEAASLGAAISTVARHLSESSQVPIHVTLDEHSTRLRVEVETELFRITQEAMNNAIKHAQCSKIDVHCAVKAPDAIITITDDGRGLQKSRSDSHGLKIMRERARLIDADLAITDGPEGGLVVTVEIDTSRVATPLVG